MFTEEEFAELMNRRSAKTPKKRGEEEQGLHFGFKTDGGQAKRDGVAESVPLGTIVDLADDAHDTIIVPATPIEIFFSPTKEGDPVTLGGAAQIDSEPDLIQLEVEPQNCRLEDGFNVRGHHWDRFANGKSGVHQAGQESPLEEGFNVACLQGAPSRNEAAQALSASAEGRPLGAEF